MSELGLKLPVSKPTTERPALQALPCPKTFNLQLPSHDDTQDSQNLRTLPAELRSWCGRMKIYTVLRIHRGTVEGHLEGEKLDPGHRPCIARLASTRLGLNRNMAQSLEWHNT